METPIFTKKDLTKLIIPLIIEQLLAVMVGMADTVMISIAGEAAVSGVSLVDTINVLLINIFSALGTGGAVVAAQYLGQKKKEKACMAANQLILIMVVIAAGIAVIGLTGNQFILALAFGKIEPAVMRNARLYFFISVLSYPFLAVYNGCAAIFRSMGNSKVSMQTSFIMNVINVAGNGILLYGLHMGVAGVALPSLFSRAIAAMIMLFLIKRKKYDIYIEKFQFRFQTKMIRRILHIGIPNGLENGMFQIGKVLVQGIIAGYGTAAIAANAVANSVAAIQIIPGNAIGLALITVVGQCVGAGEFVQAKKYTKQLMKITYIIMGSLCLIIGLLVYPIVSFYHLSVQTTSIAVSLLISHSIVAAFIWPMSFTFPNCLRAANDVKYTMIVSILSMWIFRICFSIILGNLLGLETLGIWFAMFIDWIFRSACFIIRYKKGKWMQH